MDLTKYYRLFTQQAQQHLTGLEHLLDGSNCGYTTDRLASEIHDRIHSIKGMALTLHLVAISELCQDMEHFLTNLGQHSSPPDQTALTILSDGIELLRHLIEQKGVIITETDASRLAGIRNRLGQIPVQAKTIPQKSPLTPGHIEFGEFARPLNDRLPLLSRQFGKEVGLEIRAADLMGPFTPIAPLQEILTNLLEYCVACSIEPPLVRLTKGKQRQGQVVLRPDHGDPYLSIHILDDGCGIRPQDRKAFRDLLRTKELRASPANQAATAKATTDKGDEKNWAAHLLRISQCAEALGASLTLLSNSSGGASFLVRFPLQ